MKQALLDPILRLLAAAHASQLLVVT
jgi:hypothetical protein